MGLRQPPRHRQTSTSPYPVGAGPAPSRRVCADPSSCESRVQRGHQPRRRPRHPRPCPTVPRVAPGARQPTSPGRSSTSPPPPHRTTQGPGSQLGFRGCLAVDPPASRSERQGMPRTQSSRCPSPRKVPHRLRWGTDRMGSSLLTPDDFVVCFLGERNPAPLGCPEVAAWEQLTRVNEFLHLLRVLGSDHPELLAIRLDLG